MKARFVESSDNVTEGDRSHSFKESFAIFLARIGEMEFVTWRKRKLFSEVDDTLFAFRSMAGFTKKDSRNRKVRRGIVFIQAELADAWIAGIIKKR